MANETHTGQMGSQRSNERRIDVDKVGVYPNGEAPLWHHQSIIGI